MQEKVTRLEVEEAIQRHKVAHLEALERDLLPTKGFSELNAGQQEWVAELFEIYRNSNDLKKQFDGCKETFNPEQFAGQEAFETRLKSQLVNSVTGECAITLGAFGNDVRAADTVFIVEGVGDEIFMHPFSQSGLSDIIDSAVKTLKGKANKFEGLCLNPVNRSPFLEFLAGGRVFANTTREEELLPLGERLVRAIDRGDVEKIKSFIKNGLNVNYVVTDGAYKGHTPLSIVASYGNADAITTLANAGADVTYVVTDGTYKGLTPLALAAIRGQAGAIKALVSAGADVNYVVTDGTYKRLTSLALAAKWGGANAVTALLNSGAAPIKKTENNWLSPDKYEFGLNEHTSGIKAMNKWIKDRSPKSSWSCCGESDIAVREGAPPRKSTEGTGFVEREEGRRAAQEAAQQQYSL